MPARIRKIRHDENTRLKIQAAKLVNLLHEHAFGLREMTTTQVAAAKTLLDRKVLGCQGTLPP